MNDPLPENIEGSKSVQHVVEHRIDWGYVVLGIAAIFVVYRLGIGVDGGKNQEDDGKPEVQLNE